MQRGREPVSGSALRDIAKCSVAMTTFRLQLTGIESWAAAVTIIIATPQLVRTTQGLGRVNPAMTSK